MPPVVLEKVVQTPPVVVDNMQDIKRLEAELAALNDELSKQRAINRDMDILHQVFIKRNNLFRLNQEALLLPKYSLIQFRLPDFLIWNFHFLNIELMSKLLDLRITFKIENE